MNEFRVTAPNGEILTFQIEGQMPNAAEDAAIRQVLDSPQYQINTSGPSPSVQSVSPSQISNDNNIETSVAPEIPTNNISPVVPSNETSLSNVVNNGEAPVIPDNQAPIILPIPTASMYEPISNADYFTFDEKKELAGKLYQSYKDSPFTVKNAIGELVYKNPTDNKEYRVPVPFPNIGENKIEILNNTISEGIRDGTVNVAITGGDIADLTREGYRWLKGYLTGDEFEPVSKDESIGQFLEENLSTFVEDRGILRPIGKEASGIFTIGGPVAKGLNWMFKWAKGPKQLRKFLPKTSGATGAIKTSLLTGAGMTAATDAEMSGLFVGEDALFKGLQEDMPFLQGLVDKEDEEFKQRLQNRLNILLEAEAIGGVATSVIYGGLLAAKTTWSMTIGGIMNAGNRSVREEAAIREITEHLMQAEGVTGSQREAFLQELSNALKKNSEIIMNMDNDLLTTLKINPTTMNAWIAAVENGDMQAAQRTITTALNLQKPAILTGNQTLQKSTAYARGADEQLDFTDEALDGSKVIDESVIEIQRPELERLDMAKTRVADLESELALLDDELSTLTASDDLFNSKMQDLVGTAFKIGRINLNSKTSISDRVLSAYEILKNARRAEYAKVQGGNLDVEGIFNYLREASPEVLEEASISAASTGQLSKLFKIVTEGKITEDVVGPRGGIKKVTREMNEDELLEQFTNALSDMGVSNYGDFFQMIRAPIAQLKGELFASNTTLSKSAGRQMDNFIKYIDGELLEATENPAIIDIVADAKSWDQENFLKFFGQGKLKEVADLYDLNRQRPVNYEDFTRNALSASLTNQTVSQAENIIALLARREAGSSVDDVQDFIFSEALQPIAMQLKVKGLVDPNDPEYRSAILEAVNRLETYSQIISNQGTFGNLSNNISDFAQQLQKGNIQRNAIINQLDTSIENVAKIKDEIWGSELNAFFTREGLPITDGQTAWNKLFEGFNKGTDTGRFKELADRIFRDGNQQLIDGMQAAYLRRMRKEFFSGTKDSVGGPVLNLTKIDESLDPKKAGKWFDGLEVAFGPDRSYVVDAYKDLFSKAAAEQGYRVSSSIPTQSATAGYQEKLRAFNSLVTITFGNLSRFGARLRSAGSNIIAKNANQMKYQNILDELMANPSQFAKALDRVMAQDYGNWKTNFAQAGVDALVRAGIFSDKDMEEIRQLPMDVLNNLALAEAETRTLLEDTRNLPTRLIDKMMMELGFGSEDTIRLN